VQQGQEAQQVQRVVLAQVPRLLGRVRLRVADRAEAEQDLHQVGQAALLVDVDGFGAVGVVPDMTGARWASPLTASNTACKQSSTSNSASQ